MMCLLVARGLLRIYDVSNPAKPVMIGTVKVGPVQRIALAGSLAYLAGADGLQTVDLANPAMPVLTDSYKTAGPARDVAVAGPLVFVAVGRAASGDAATGTGTAGVVILRRIS